MRKLLSILLCILFLFSSQLVFAEEKYYNMDIESCSEIKVSYYNGGEFSSPLMTGYYNYVTTDTHEMEDILMGLKNMHLVPFDGGWAASGGEALTIYVDGERVIRFYLSMAKKYLCRTADTSYEFSIEEYRNLEDVVLKYKMKNDTKVYLDDTEIRFYNSPIVMKDRTLVPCKVISEALGLKVSGDSDRVIFENEKQKLIFYLQEDCIYENGHRKTIYV